MNNCIYSGHLGRDPEQRTTPSGHDVCNFSIAVKQQGDRPALWVEVAVWGKQGEHCAKYLTKGSLVTVVGETGIDTYQTQGGEFRAKLTLNAYRVEFGPRSESQGQKPQQEEQPRHSAGDAQSTVREMTRQQEKEDDLPF